MAGACQDVFHFFEDGMHPTRWRKRKTLQAQRWGFQQGRKTYCWRMPSSWSRPKLKCQAAVPEQTWVTDRHSITGDMHLHGCTEVMQKAFKGFAWW